MTGPNENRSHQYIVDNNLEEACTYFEALYQKNVYTEQNIDAAKWYMTHLIHASKYVEAKKISDELETIAKGTATRHISDRSKGDIIYSLALCDYYHGSFKRAINWIFPIGNISEYSMFSGGKSLIDLHYKNDPSDENDYQQGLNYMLAGKCYWKMGHYSRACFHFYLAIWYFHNYDPNCIWLPKIYGLIGLVYSSFEHFYNAYKCIELGHHSLELILGAKIKEHHIYACLESDKGDIKLREWKYNFNNPNKNLEAVQIDECFDEIKDHFLTAEAIFSTIYSNKNNRYSATVEKNLFDLYSWKSLIITNSTEKLESYNIAKKYFKTDIKIREKVLFPDENKADKRGHHPTIARAYNLDANMKLKLLDVLPSSAREINLDVAKDSQKAIYSVVEGYKHNGSFEEGYVNFTWENPRLGKPWSKNKKKSYELDNISSFNTLLDSLRIKIQALLNLSKLKFSMEERNHLKDTIDTAIEFIEHVRPRLKTKVANFALSSKLKPLYEIILEYLYTELSENKDKHTEEELEELKEHTFKIIEESKNYSLIQQFKANNLDSINNIDSWLTGFFENFMLPELEEDVDFNFINENYKIIDEICREFRKQEEEDIKRNSDPFDEISKDNVQALKHLETIDYSVANDQILLVTEKAERGLKSVVISYFFGVNVVYLIKLDGKDLEFFKINEHPKQIKDLVEELLYSLNNLPKEVGTKRSFHVAQLDILSAKLYAILLGEIEFEQEQRFLLIVPDGELNKLPFDILLTDTYSREEALAISEEELNNINDSQLLIHRFYTSYHFSVSLLNESINEYWNRVETSNYNGINQRNRLKLDYMGIGSTFNLKSKELDDMYMQQEVKIVGRMFFYLNKSPSLKLRVFINELKDNDPWTSKISDRILKELNDYGYIEVLHIATHNNNQNIIYLDKEISIDLNVLTKIITEGLKINIVVLSGCDTGSGEIRGGEMTNFLARYFLGSEKVSNVINMLTQTNDREHEEFNNVIINFFELLLEKKDENVRPSFAVALAQAKRKKMKEKKIGFGYYDRLTAIAGPILIGCPLDTLFINK